MQISSKCSRKSKTNLQMELELELLQLKLPERIPSKRQTNCIANLKQILKRVTSNIFDTSLANIQLGLQLELLELELLAQAQSKSPANDQTNSITKPQQMYSQSLHWSCRSQSCWSRSPSELKQTFLANSKQNPFQICSKSSAGAAGAAIYVTNVSKISG